MIYRFLLTILLFFTYSHGAILVNKETTELSILENSQYFIDNNSNLTIKEITKKKFQNSKTDYLKLGYTKSTIWIRFKLKNDSKEKLRKYIYIDNTVLDTVYLYTKENKQYKEEGKGRFLVNQYTENITVHPNFQIHLEKGETKEFYIKSYSISSANYIKIFLENERSLYIKESSFQLTVALFLGAMIALIIYNIFIFIFTKEYTYLFYVLFIFFVTLNYASYSNLSSIVLGEYFKIDNFTNIYYIGLAVIFALLFIIRLLEVNRNKIHLRISYILIFVNFLFLVFNSKDPYLIEELTFATSIASLFVFYLCIYSFIKGISQAKYILVGWIANILAILAIILKQHGIVNPIDYFPYFYELFVFLEAVLFSIALASKLNKTKELETSLQTNKILISELHHRTKNNMQFIIFMYRMKLEKYINKDIDKKLYEAENIIQAMSKTHEIIYDNNNLEKIETKEYFQSLINSLNINDVKINLFIKTSINVQQSIFCGLILNELITNSLKHAFKEIKGEINILLSKEDNKYTLIYTDNGNGFDYEKMKFNSFGLSFIEAVIVDELKGDIKFETKDRTKVIITF